MIYRNFKDTGMKTSLLGLGGMRFPRIGDTENVDFPKAEKIVEYAYEHGINYFDTAYVYHDGDSERLFGKVLTKYPRDSYYIADKMPIFIITDKKQVAEVFQEQLDRCQVDYFDFYLCHSMNEVTIDDYIKYDVIPYLVEMKKQGKIKQLGFSNHGSPETLKRALDLADWDFVQLQLNYLDWQYYHGEELYNLCKERNIPVMVMEPVRGGRLADLTPESNALLKAAAPDKSIPSWAMRWMQGLDGVQVVLSGAGDTQMLDDNLKTFSEINLLNDEEQKVLDKALDIFMEKFSIPCTACRYCTETCPQKLQIPDILSIYNEMLLTDDKMPYIKSMQQPEDRQPGNCIGCGACTKRCPQFIDIPGKMKAMLEKREKWATDNAEELAKS